MVKHVQVQWCSVQFELNFSELFDLDLWMVAVCDFVVGVFSCCCQTILSSFPSIDFCIDACVVYPSSWTRARALAKLFSKSMTHPFQAESTIGFRFVPFLCMAQSEAQFLEVPGIFSIAESPSIQWRFKLGPGCSHGFVALVPPAGRLPR